MPDFHFYVDDAVKYDVKSAVILSYLSSNLSIYSIYIEHKDLLKDDGSVWFRCPLKIISENLPFIKPRSISTKLLELERLGVIKSSTKYNSDPFDGTKWYAILENK